MECITDKNIDKARVLVKWEDNYIKILIKPTLKVKLLTDVIQNVFKIPFTRQILYKDQTKMNVRKRFCDYEINCSEIPVELTLSVKVFETCSSNESISGSSSDSSDKSSNSDNSIESLMASVVIFNASLPSYSKDHQPSGHSVELLNNLKMMDLNERSEIIKKTNPVTPTKLKRVTESLTRTKKTCPLKYSLSRPNRPCALSTLVQSNPALEKSISSSEQTISLSQETYPENHVESLKHNTCSTNHYQRSLQHSEVLTQYHTGSPEHHIGYQEHIGSPQHLLTTPERPIRSTQYHIGSPPHHFESPEQHKISPQPYSGPSKHHGGKSTHKPLDVNVMHYDGFKMLKIKNQTASTKIKQATESLTQTKRVCPLKYSLSRPNQSNSLSSSLQSNSVLIQSDSSPA